MTPRPGEVLVAILNNVQDFQTARDQFWYRIPRSSAHKWVGERWPPEAIAFYLTKPFASDAHTIRHYAPVNYVTTATRAELFPTEEPNVKSDRVYYRLHLGALQSLPQPLVSRRKRRITFIPTTWTKFIGATDINDLYDDSPLEDALWHELKKRHIPAERQEFVQARQNDFALDFAVYCAKGKIAIETDGDSWHISPEKAVKDNDRDNALESTGWRVLRFTTKQIRERMEEDCLPIIAATINDLGGVDEGNYLPRKVSDKPGLPLQGTLFEPGGAG